MVSTDNYKSSRTYPGWDTSYKSCLCLLLIVLALSIVLLLIALLVPGKSRHPEKSPHMPEDFDRELYSRLLQEYRARTEEAQKNQKTTRLVSIAKTSTYPIVEPITTRDEPAKKWPMETTTKENTTILPYTKSQGTHFTTSQSPARTSMEFIKFYTVQEITDKARLSSAHPVMTKAVQEDVDKSTKFYTTRFFNATVNSSGTETTQQYDTSHIASKEVFQLSTPTSDSVELITSEPVTERVTRNVDMTSNFVEIKDHEEDIIHANSVSQKNSDVEMATTSATLPNSNDISTLQRFSTEDAFPKPFDDQTSFEITTHTNQGTDQITAGNPQELIVIEGYKPDGGQNIFEQKTIIKEKIVEKDCPNPPKVCSTNICKRSASEMLALMDHSIDPCDDFYWYACNGIQIHRMEDRNSENILLDKIKDFTVNDPLTAKFKQLYESCMDFSTENYLYLRNYTEHIFNDEKYNGLDKTEALSELISTLLMLNPSASNSRLMPIFDLVVDVDISGSFMPTLTIPMESSLIVSMNSIDPYEEMCLKKIAADITTEKSVSIIYQAYIDCLNDIEPYIINLNTTLYSLGVLEHLPKLNKSQKIIDIEHGVQFDVFEVLGSVSKRSRLEHLEASQSSSIYLDIEQLQVEYPQINWTTVLSNLFKERGQSITKIRVIFKETLDKIFTFFENNKFTDIKNLIMAMTLHDLHSEIKIIENKCVDGNFCLRLSANLMEDIAAKILSSKIIKKDLKYADEYITNVFEQMKGKFIEFIQSSKWTTDDQKLLLSEKLYKIKINANAFNLYFNDGVLAYRNANLNLSKNFAENFLEIKRNKRNLMYEKIANNPGSVWTYLYNPMGTEIFSVLGRDEIVVPIGLLAKYAVKKRAYLKDYEIYAKLGFKISKAILQFFTPHKLYKILQDLKESEDFKNFLEIELADPPITKFENIFGITFNKEDIKLTAEERFSDDGALRLVFEVLSNISNSRNDRLIWLNLTNSQFFYTSFAQEYCAHTPDSSRIAIEIAENSKLHSYFRINSVLMNSAFFADTFNCRTGSSMNPEFKVNQFPHIEQPDVDYDKNQDVLETF